MKRLVVLGVAALTAFGFAAMGCSSDSKPGATAGSGGSGNEGGAGTTGGSTSTGTAKTGGGTSTTTTGGSTSASTSAACSTTNGTYTEATTFAATDTTTWAYKLNKWPAATSTATLTRTTTAPTGIDCTAGCALLSVDFPSGTAAYTAGVIEEYFGATSTSVQNLLNETYTVKIAVVVTQATGATVAAPIDVDLTGYDTFTTTTYVDNLWVFNLGKAPAMAATAGFATKTYKIIDVQVPSWSPTRTVCASSIHTLGIRVQNSAAIDATNGAKVDVYIQSIDIAP